MKFIFPDENIHAQKQLISAWRRRLDMETISPLLAGPVIGELP